MTQGERSIEAGVVLSDPRIPVDAFEVRDERWREFVWEICWHVVEDAGAEASYPDHHFEVRDREAQRRRERSERTSGYETVEKDW